MPLFATSERGAAAAGSTLLGVVEHVHRATGLLKVIQAEMRELPVAGKAPPRELTLALEELCEAVSSANVFASQTSPEIAAPTSALVTAQLEAGVIDGRRKAEEVALRAGFLGGSGPLAILATVAIGIILCPYIFGHCMSAMKHGSTLEGSVHFAHGFLFHQPVACLCFARAVCLVRGYAREAHQLTILGLGWVGTVGVVIWLLKVEFTAVYGCSWRPYDKSNSETKQALGQQCGAVETVNSLFKLIVVLICSLIAVRLYQLRREECTTWAIRVLFVFALNEMFIACVYTYTWRAAPVSQILFCLFLGSLATLLEYKRRRALSIAAKLLADDLEQYNKQWANISQAGSHAAIPRLFDAVAAEQKHIAAVKRGELSRPADDVCHSVITRGIVQRIHSLALIFASAHTLNPHFQKKAIGWGAEKSIPVKQAARAVEKMLRSYANDARCIKDLVRNNVTCSTLDEVAETFERVARDESVAIVQIKNGFDLRYDSKKSGGYRDIKLSLVVVDAFARGSAVEEHICELQILHKDIHQLKFELGGHDRYEKARDALGA